MELTWPLVGRAAELQRAAMLLRGSRGGIVLAGPAGVGKTRLATECLGIAAAQGYVPLRVAATQGAAGIPFGAFASLVPDLAPSSDLLEILRQIARAVAGRGEGKPVAVFVDDAHLLDESSAALTHLLATTEQTFVLATLRSGEPAPDSVVALWKDGLAERLEIHPLPIHEVEKLLAAALGGPVDGATVHLLQKRTEGNALFLREVVLGGLEAGVFHREEGVWRLSGPLPPSSRLIEIIEARLGYLEDPARRALALLALGEPLEVEILQVAHPSVDLEALEGRALVHVQQEGRRLSARLPHPLYGEVLRARLSPLGARASARALADALKATGIRRREDVLRLATWSLEGGSPLSAEVMLTAATTARQRYDFPLAERLASAAVEAGAGFEAGLILAQVCWLQGRAAEALQQLGALGPAATTDPQRTLLAMARISVLDWGLRQTDAALKVAEEAEAAIDDLSCRDQITAERARILGRSGRYSAAVALVVPLLSRVSGGALVSACFAAGTSMEATGQFAAGIDASERGLAAHLHLMGPPLPFGPYLHLVIRCALLIGAGRLAEAKVLGEQEYDQAVKEGSLESQSFFSLVLAWDLLSEGRVATAASIAAESAAAFRELDWRLWVRNALAFRAHALALLGQVPTARAVLSEVDQLGVPESEFLGPEVLRARAWTEVAAGDLAAGRLHLHQAVAMAQEAGAYAFESAALHDLARLGLAAEVAPRLRELTDVVEGVLAQARSAHAEALAARNAVGLEAASQTFEELGALLLSAEASADSAVVWRQEGEPRRAVWEERRASGLAGRCEGARTPSLAIAAPVRAALTHRELEIARLAAEGLANKEIAARLCLSHRTVENQLHAVYEKLGIEGRAVLAQVLEGAPGPFSVR
jgi:DNA-binding CsgD family transcriptional regulator